MFEQIKIMIFMKYDYFCVSTIHNNMSGHGISLLIAACIMSACSVDYATKITISARPESTKSGFDADGKIAFVDGDCMTIFDGSHNRKFTTSAVYDDGSADFSGVVSTPQDSYIAVFPYQENCNLYGDGVRLNILHVQEAVAGSFDPLTNLSVGRAEIVGGKYSVNLKNVCALLKFSVPEGTSYAAAMLQTNYEYLTGAMLCSVDDTPVLTPDYEPTTSSVILKGTITGGNWYYMAVSPAVLEGGFALHLFDSTQDLDRGSFSTVKATNTTITLKRSEILNLGIIGAEPGAAFENIAGETVFEW